MKKLFCLLALAGAPLVSGCRVYHGHTVRYVDPGPVHVSHVHGPNCGHAWVDGYWVDTRPRVVYVEERTYRPSFGATLVGAALGVGLHHAFHHHHHHHHGHRVYRRCR
jgi:hypothetical protein